MAIDQQHSLANDVAHGGYPFKPGLHIARRRSVAATLRRHLVERSDLDGSVTLIECVTCAHCESGGRAVNCTAVDIGIERDRGFAFAAQEGRKTVAGFTGRSVVPSLVESTAYRGIRKVQWGFVARWRRLAIPGLK